MTLQVALNGLDVTSLEATGVQWSLDQLTGWGATKPTISPVQKPRQAGAWAGLSYSSARHLVLSGQVAAPTQDLMTDAIDRLVTAAARDAVTVVVQENARTRVLYARREDEVFFTYISDKMASWSLQVVAVDPRKFGAPQSNNTLLPVSTGGFSVGALTVPFAINSTVISGGVSLVNSGNIAGPVVLRIDGPATGPQITHVGSGSAATLAFSSSLVLGSGEWLTVNMDARTALANDQASRNGYITSRGWSGFDPGLNTWSFNASGYNAASLLTVTATPAWD